MLVSLPCIKKSYNLLHYCSLLLSNCMLPFQFTTRYDKWGKRSNDLSSAPHTSLDLSTLEYDHLENATVGPGCALNSLQNITNFIRPSIPLLPRNLDWQNTYIWWTDCRNDSTSKGSLNNSHLVQAASHLITLMEPVWLSSSGGSVVIKTRLGTSLCSQGSKQPANPSGWQTIWSYWEDVTDSYSHGTSWRVVGGH